MEFKEIKKQVKKSMDHNRYEHTKGVMYTAGCLAMAYGYDYEKAMLAGLLHDCAKCIDPEEQIKICKKHNVEVSEVEMENTALLHAKTGAILAEEKYGIKDPEILHAIKVHTTGCENMNLLDKIIFTADYIEPGRDKAQHLETLRQEAFRDINACIADILYDTIHYLNHRSGRIDPQTAKTYEAFQQYEKEREWKL